jgi:hypothetical protein
MFLTEMLLVLYFLRPWEWNPYEPVCIILMSAIYVQVACLCLLLMVRLAVVVTQAIDKPSGVVTKPYDFYAVTKDDKSPIYCIVSPIYRIVSGVAIRCVNSVLWIFTRFTACPAMTSISLSPFSDVFSPWSLRWSSSHSCSPTS